MSSDPLRAVADELEIRNLLARLAHAADDGEDLVADYVSLFTEDAVWDAGAIGTRKGHADLLEGARERRSAGTAGPGSSSRHLVDTTAIEVDGDQATGRSVFRFYTQTDDQPVLAMLGAYEDRFRRTEAGWKLAHRIIHRSGDPTTGAD